MARPGTTLRQAGRNGRVADAGGTGAGGCQGDVQLREDRVDGVRQGRSKIDIAVRLVAEVLDPASWISILGVLELREVLGAEALVTRLGADVLL
jgi:hypothetical protein